MKMPRLKRRQSEAVWERWFAWYPAAVPTNEHAYWVWLEFVERKEIQRQKETTLQAQSRSTIRLV